MRRRSTYRPRGSLMTGPGRQQREDAALGFKIIAVVLALGGFGYLIAWLVEQV